MYAYDILSFPYAKLAFPEKGRREHLGIDAMLPSAQRNSPYEINPGLVAAFEPRMCAPPEQLAEPLQMPFDQQGLPYTHRCEYMVFPDSHDKPASIFSTDSLEPGAFGKSVQAVSQPKSPDDEVRLAHIHLYGNHIPPSHASHNPRVGGSYNVVNGNRSSLLGYPATRAMIDTSSTASSPPLQYSDLLLDWSAGRESPATEVMNGEGNLSSSLTRSPFREEQEDIVQPRQGSCST